MLRLQGAPPAPPQPPLTRQHPRSLPITTHPWQEAASSHFSVLAFAAFATSVGFEALRVVLTERLLAGEGAAPRMSAAEVLVYIGPLTGLMLLAGSVLVEGPHILRRVRDLRVGFARMEGLRRFDVARQEAVDGDGAERECHGGLR